MATNSSNIVTMIDTKHISTLKWTTELGDRISEFRSDKGFTRDRVVELAAEQGGTISRKYVQLLEQPGHRISGREADYISVEIDVIQSLLAALGKDLEDLFRSAKISL